jgi:hypothetical protein
MKKSPVLRSTPLGAVGLTTNSPPPPPPGPLLKGSDERQAMMVDAPIGLDLASSGSFVGMYYSHGSRPRQRQAVRRAHFLAQK